MKKFLAVIAAILCLTVVAAYAQSLGDIAREEQERRNSIPADKTIIIEVAPPAEPEEKVSTDGADNEEDYDETENPQSADEDVEESDYDEEAAAETTAGSKVKTELYLRNAMADVQDRIKQLEGEANELDTRRNALQLQRNRASTTRRNAIDNEINKLGLEQELNKKNLEQAREERRSLQNEARSGGSLPGFVE